MIQASDTLEAYERALEAMAGTRPDVLLVNPNRRTYANATVSHIKGPRPRQPLGIAYTAAFLGREGIRARLLDASILNWRADRTAAFVARVQPRILVVSTTQMDRWQNPDLDLSEVFAFLDAAAVPGGPILVVEGTHGTVTPDWVFSKCPAAYVVRGEPELTTLELVKALLAGGPVEGIAGLSLRTPEGVRSGPDRAFDKPLDEYPFPAYADLPMRLYRYTLEDLPPPFSLMLTSRGCPISCTFCLKAMMPKGIRFRSPASVVAEMRHLERDHGIRSVYFQDWEFAANRARAKEVCRALIAAGVAMAWGCSCRVADLDDELVRLMVEARCVVVNVGFETGSQRMLDAVEKHVKIPQVEAGLAACRKYGLNIRFFGLVNLPGETAETIEESTDFLVRHGMDVVNPNIPIPYPGTRLHADLGREAAWDEVERFSGRVRSDLSPGEATRLFHRSLHRKRYGRLYPLNPRYLGRVIWPKVRRRLAGAV